MVDARGGIVFEGRPDPALSNAGEQVKIASCGPDTPRSVLVTGRVEF